MMNYLPVNDCWIYVCFYGLVYIEQYNCDIKNRSVTQSVNSKQLIAKVYFQKIILAWNIICNYNIFIKWL